MFGKSSVLHLNINTLSPAFTVELLSEGDIFLMSAFEALSSEQTDGSIRDRVIQIPPVKQVALYCISHLFSSIANGRAANHSSNMFLLSGSDLW